MENQVNTRTLISPPSTNLHPHRDLCKMTSAPPNFSTSSFSTHNKQITSSKIRCLSERNGSLESCFNGIFGSISLSPQKYEASWKSHSNIRLSPVNLPSLEEPSVTFDALIQDLQIPTNCAKGQKVHLHKNHILYTIANSTKLAKVTNATTWSQFLALLGIPLLINAVYNLKKNYNKYQATADASQEEKKLMSHIRHKHMVSHFINASHAFSFLTLGMAPLGPIVATINGMLDSGKYKGLTKDFEDIQATYSTSECDPEYSKTMSLLDTMRKDYLKERRSGGEIKTIVYGMAIVGSVLAAAGATILGAGLAIFIIPSVLFACYEGGNAIKNWLTAKNLKSELGVNFNVLEKLNDEIQDLKEEAKKRLTPMQDLEVKEKYNLIEKDGKTIVTNITELNSKFLKMHPDLMAERILWQLFPEDNNNDSLILKEYLKSHTVQSHKNFDVAYKALEKLWPPINAKAKKRAISIMTYLQEV